MEKRLLLAVLLMSAVIMITNILFPPPEQGAEGVGADSVAVAAAPAPRVAPIVAAPRATDAVPVDTVVVASGRYRYAFSTRGAALVRAELLQYPSYSRPGQPVQLVPEGADDFLAHRLVVGADTVDLRRLNFQPSATALTVGMGGEQALRFAYGDAGGFGVEITYTFSPETYVVGVRGQVSGLGGQRATLLSEIGPGLAMHEAQAHHAERELAVVTRTLDDVDREPLGDFEGVQPLEGPFTWAGIKDKYFLAALIAGDQRPLSGAVVRDLPDGVQVYVEDGDTTRLELPRGRLTTALPVGQDGSFALQAYLGPQSYEQLAAVGFELEDVTPYGYSWLQPIIRPFAAAILWILGELHNSLGIAYGWVLVIFGVMMRIVLWPLNAKAMRAQMKNAAVAPMMQEIREKHKDSPQKQQEEMIRLYKEHGFNPMAGCLPLLVPFPVLITLFFVFQNTIVFRGADFLWLPDLSLPDPWYLLPIFLVAATFATQWITMQMGGMEQTPQMKVMTYVMPLVFGVIFFNLPAGLNLYYATNQVAGIPQQILIAKERRRAQEAAKQANARPAAPAPPRSRKRKAKG
jgi:YidC/Oxa1 family membrane protein insertase